MDTEKLTKENQQNIGVPAGVHAQAKELARRDGVKMYQVVAIALDLYAATNPVNGSDQDGAETLLREALDLWHGTHELCDVADTPEWTWRWRVAYLLDQAEPAQ